MSEFDEAIRLNKEAEEACNELYKACCELTDTIEKVKQLIYEIKYAPDSPMYGFEQPLN